MVPSAPTAALVEVGGTMAVSVHAMQARVALVLDMMANVLEKDKDYGKIPGTDKPTLYKPGAEKLCMAFQLAPETPAVEDLSASPDEVRYRVSIPLVSASGRTIAVGLGEASTREEKYSWRRPVCQEEFDETPAHLRREKWFKGQSGAYKGQQIRTNPSDLANTVLKMAHKRALIHVVLLGTAAGSVFNQDLEDFTKELRESLLDEEGHSQAAGPRTQQPQRRSESGGEAKSAKPAPPGAKFVIGVVESVTKVSGKKFTTITIKGDRRAFNAWNDSGAQVITDAQQFEGTDHQVRLLYTEQVKGDTTYYNPVGLSIADAEPVTPAGQQKPAETVTADDVNPFAAGERQPGAEG